MSVSISNRKHLTWELEAKIKARIEWQNDKAKEAAGVHGDNSNAVHRLHGYVGALRWVLEQAGCTETKEGA